MPIIKNSISWLKLFAVLFAGYTIGAPAALAKQARTAEKASSFGITAESVYAVDYTNRKVIFSRRPNLAFYPASTAKLLTALVVLDRMDLNARVVVPATALRVQPTKAGLAAGVTYSVADLLRVLLATSANDAGVTLAAAAAGSEKNFSVLMNKKARALGAKDSHFVNATGLPDRRQVTTAYDLSIITRAAFSQPFVKKVMAEKSVTIKGSDGKTITRRNHNRLLWQISEPCVLGKTGYTRSAGHCYAGIAYFDDRRISVVILKSRKPWADLHKILRLTQK